MEKRDDRLERVIAFAEENFSEDLKDVFRCAFEAAQEQYGHESLSVDHLFMFLLTEPDVNSILTELIADTGVDRDSFSLELAIKSYDEQFRRTARTYEGASQDYAHLHFDEMSYGRDVIELMETLEKNHFNADHGVAPYVEPVDVLLAFYGMERQTTPMRFMDEAQINLLHLQDVIRVKHAVDFHNEMRAQAGEKHETPDEDLDTDQDTDDENTISESRELVRSGNAYPFRLAGTTKAETLSKYGTDLTELAFSGKLDPITGRDSEVDRSIKVVSRKNKANPVLIGEAGVGKTAVVQGIAQRIVDGGVPKSMRYRHIVELDVGAMVAGTKYRGDFEKRLKGVIDDVKALKAKGVDVTLFIDELHNIVGAGKAGGAMDASNILKPELAASGISVIGATTIDEYKKYIETDAALDRRFQAVVVKEPTIEQAQDILLGKKQSYEAHHDVYYEEDAIRAIPDLCQRFITDKKMPDTCFDLLDDAGVEVASEGRKRVTVKDVQTIVANRKGFPLEFVAGGMSDHLRGYESKMKSQFFDQDDAIHAMKKALLISQAGLNEDNKVAGSFLFLGPTGSGKTDMAVQTAKILGVDAVRYDMADYMEKHAISRLIGAPPGYTGFDEGAKLAEDLRTAPNGLFIFDEVEKAHPDVMNILLQVLEYGEFTDAKGRTHDMRNATIVLTGNLGTVPLERKRSIGFMAHEEDNAAEEKTVDMNEVKKHFLPEVLNRIGAIIPFNRIQKDTMPKIVDKVLGNLQDRLSEKKGLSVEFDAAAKGYLADAAYDPEMGARPLKRLVNDEIASEIAYEVLDRGITTGGFVSVTFNEEAGKLDVAVSAEKPKAEKARAQEPVYLLEGPEAP
ncbi:MAG: ATP-dependent Clp protease ATP-binding subunit [Alphaproteobacteria bacterium]|jgi:ATP-dependent Clp protease ATP-binding subunit ClpA|nr:ATP-dependent Clp protease ATP-binding subunit [Alphaproteobacteria bacterium]MDP7222146.1 ATP-dependent Clp protease ATP-binding subunit [Alphaproteobacteria bacterium]